MGEIEEVSNVPLRATGFRVATSLLGCDSCTLLAVLKSSFPNNDTVCVLQALPQKFRCIVDAVMPFLLCSMQVHQVLMVSKAYQVPLDHQVLMVNPVNRACQDLMDLRVHVVHLGLQVCSAGWEAAQPLALSAVQMTCWK